MYQQTIKYGAVFVAYLYGNEIKDTIQSLYTYLESFVVKELIIIPDDNPQLSFAIKQFIQESGIIDHVLLATDGTMRPNYKVAPGNYVIPTNYGTMYFNITNDEIKIRSQYFGTIDSIQNFLNATYSYYCSSDRTTMFFTSDD